jgi:hypothetical protein
MGGGQLDAIGNGNHLHAVPAAGYGPPAGLENMTARAAALCERAAAALDADPPPPRETLRLAAQLEAAALLLGLALRAGTIAAAAYERGRLDERMHRAACPMPA